MTDKKFNLATDDYSVVQQKVKDMGDGTYAPMVAITVAGPLGTQTAANSLPVTLSSDGPFASNFGAKADAAAADDTGSYSFLAFVKRALQNWTTLLTAVATGGVTVKSGAGTSVAVVISSGQSLSGSIDLGNQRLGRIGFPSNIDSATKLSFQTSHNGTTWRNLYDQYGTEYTVTAGVDRSVVPDLTMFAAARYLKIRLDTAAAPKVTTADRTIDLSTLA